MKLLSMFLMSGLCVSVQAKTIEKTVTIPKGMYVHSDNPPCGMPTTLANLGKDPKVTATVAKVLGPKAAAVLILINQADEIAAESGGDGAKLWKGLVGRRDGASCAAICVSLPANARPKTVILSSRSGAGGFNKPFRSGNILENESAQDFSGWRDVVAAKSGGRWLVCGTGTNWSHDQSALKRIAVTY